jgi:transposase
MGQHGSARLSVHSRLTIALRVQEQGWTVTAAARAANVSRQTASKWVGRYRELGEVGLSDRSTRPRTIHRRLGASVVRQIEQLRRQRLGSHRIAWMLHLARSSVYRVLRRLGLGRLPHLEPRPDPNRYEWPTPGDLVHLDTKKIGRMGRSAGWRFDRSQKGRDAGLGWSVVHVAIDDHSRLVYVEELPDERPETAVAFLGRALEIYAGHRITVRRVMTDNGNPYRSLAFPAELGRRQIRHIRTRALHATDQRQGGGDGQDPAERVGLRPGVSIRLSPLGGAPAVRRLLQSRASTRRLERRPTDRPGPSMMPWSGTARRVSRPHTFRNRRIPFRRHSQGLSRRRSGVSCQPHEGEGEGRGMSGAWSGTWSNTRVTVPRMPVQV